MLGLQNSAVCGILKTLTLGGNKITDAGLAKLNVLPDLKSLSLGGNPITDVGRLTCRH